MKIDVKTAYHCFAFNTMLSVPRHTGGVPLQYNSGMKDFDSTNSVAARHRCAINSEGSRGTSLGARAACPPIGGSRIYGIALYCLLFSLFLTGCTTQKETPKSAQPPTIPAVKIISAILNREDVFPAELLAYQDVAIYPKVPGFIKWIGVDRGSTVKQGQLMVQLEAPELYDQKNEALDKANAAVNELAEAQARLESDDSTYQRVKTAAKIPGVISEDEVVVLSKKVEGDKARVVALTGRLEAAKKAANSFKDIASYLKITAPFDGYVTERNMHTGSFVGPLGHSAYPPIVRVQELSLLRLVAPVPEVDAGGVEQGAKVNFTVSTYPGEIFSGTVARIGNYLDEKTRTMPVELNVWNPDWRLKPGMFTEVHWPTKRSHPSLFVPPSAVGVNTYNSFLCCLDGGKVTIIPVKRGQSMHLPREYWERGHSVRLDADLVEVFGNIKEGQIVALHATDELRDGTPITPDLTTQ